MKAIDVSGFQPANITSLIEQFNPDIVVVKLYLPDESWSPLVRSQEHSIAQAQCVRDAGIELQGYVFCYDGLPPHYTIEEAVKLVEYTGATKLWVDFETYLTTWPSLVWAREAMSRCNELMGTHKGIYTAKWFWQYYMENIDDFANVDLWNALYGDPPPPFSPYGGWTTEYARQWTSTPIDQNIFYVEDGMNDAQLAELYAIADILDNPSDPAAGFDALFERIAAAWEPLHQYGGNDSGSEWLKGNFRGIAERLRKLPGL